MSRKRRSPRPQKEPGKGLLLAFSFGSISKVCSVLPLPSQGRKPPPSLPLWGRSPSSGGFGICRLIVKGFVILQAINCNYCCSEVKHRRCERIQTGVLTPGTRWSTKLSSERATEQATCLFSVCLCFCRPFRAFFVAALLPGVVTPVCVLSSLRDFLPMPLC